MTTTTQGAFEPDAMTAVMAHMNNHHRDDCILIARAFGSLDDVRDASLVGIEVTGARFTAVTGERPVDVTVPWGQEVTIRSHLRDEMARMYRDSCARLGITPRAGND